MDKKNQNKKGNLRWKIGAVGAAFLLCLSGCSSGTKRSADSMKAVTSMAKSEDYNAAEYADDISYEEASAGDMYYGNGMTGNTNSTAEQVTPGGVETNRKLIRTINMDVETKTFDELIASVEEQVRNVQGYIEQSNIYNGNYNRNGYKNTSTVRNANITIRVPSNQMDSFLSQLGGISNVVRRSESQEDVTLNYVDLKSHKEALLVEQQRLLELMEKTQYVDELITLESRLSELRYQIESMESQLRTFDNKVDYATLYLNVTEVEELTPVQEETATERMSRGFTESLKTVKEGFVDFGVGLVVNLPFIIVFLLICFAIVMFIIGIVKFCLGSAERKKRKALKKEKKAMEKAEKTNEKQ